LERKIVWAEAQIWVAWGEICASGAPNDFSRSSETPNAPTHFPDEPFFSLTDLTPQGGSASIFVKIVNWSKSQVLSVVEGYEILSGLLWTERDMKYEIPNNQ